MVKHSDAILSPPPPPSSDFLSPSPKPRGRPPKPKTPSDPAAAAAASEDGPKRGRGRPKLVKPGPDVSGPETTPKKPRGRPPGPVKEAAAPGGSRPRGRPPGVSRPKKVTVPGGSRPRGRPRKFPAAGRGILALVGMKRGRGRPPKAGGGGGVAKKLRMYSGKPLGRPRKVAAQNLVAYQDLTNKLVHFQSRVKHAVDLVRPYFTSEATPYVYGALQELEVLANTDMTAPPQAEPQQPPAVVA